MPSTNVGSQVAVRTGAKIGHDVKLGDFVFVGMNASLCGYIKVAEGARIAPGAIVREHTHVGRFAVVGFGAVVLEDVPDYAVVVGNPARQISSTAADPDQGSVGGLLSEQ